MRVIQFLSVFILSLCIYLQSVNSKPWNADLEKLLTLHNFYRHKVMNCELENQPPAKYLPDLQWDDNLAYYAQKLADTCVYGHNNVTVPSYVYVGQNIAGYYSIEKAVEAWFNEYKVYDYHTQHCRKVCGHYTQMVWQTTTHVGCGVRNCQGTNFPYGLYIVCNYGEGGNYMGEHPYETKSKRQCGKRSVQAEETPKTISISKTKTAIEKPSFTYEIPQPEWKKLMSTWNDYAITQGLHGSVAQTCICFD